MRTAHSSCRSDFIGRKTLALAAADDALSGKRAARFGDDGALRLAAAVGMEINDDPILNLAKLMGAGRV